MEILNNIIETTLGSFDFAYCIIVNVLTYTIIQCLPNHISTWYKRLVLFCVILFTGAVYYFTGSDMKLLLNSAILAPIFWSWIMKPICKKFNIDYKPININEL